LGSAPVLAGAKFELFGEIGVDYRLPELPIVQRYGQRWLNFAAGGHPHPQLKNVHRSGRT